jgi:tRNA 2-thiouridine synthesizing protein B
MSSLHIVSGSAFQTSALARAIALVQADDAILLIEDGVYGAANTDANQTLLAALPEGVSLYVLSEDLAARALPSRLSRFNEVTYAGFVDLVCQHNNSVSWS